MISPSDIEKAYTAIRPHIVRTPIVYSQKLSELCGCRTLFKLENFQMTGSFKERGALNKLLNLSEVERKASFLPRRAITPRGLLITASGWASRRKSSCL
jgi:threonine dehydratase